MIGLAVRIAGLTGATGRAQKALGWLTLIAAAALVAWLAFCFFQRWLGEQKAEAVKIDRTEIRANVSEANHRADREGAAIKHAQDIAANHAAAQQMEAINASLHDPGGDPLGAALDRMR